MTSRADDNEPLVPKGSLSQMTRLECMHVNHHTRYILVKPTHLVHIPDLLDIRPASEVVIRLGLHPYDLSMNGIIWAGDWSRGDVITGPRSGYEKVINAKDDKLRRGLSVEDPEQFLAMLKRLYPGITNAAMGEQEEAEVRSERSR